ARPDLLARERQRRGRPCHRCRKEKLGNEGVGARRRAASSSSRHADWVKRGVEASLRSPLRTPSTHSSYSAKGVTKLVWAASRGETPPEPPRIKTAPDEGEAQRQDSWRRRMAFSKGFSEHGAIPQPVRRSTA